MIHFILIQGKIAIITLIFLIVYIIVAGITIKIFYHKITILCVVPIIAKSNPLCYDEPMKLLIFQMKTLCYNSYTYFASSLGEALKSLGHEVHYFSLEKDGLEKMEELPNQGYDAILDFNSDLPKVTMDDGGYYLDLFSAPFFDFLLDHPLYHHDMLKHPLKNFHVCCLDSNHCNYLKEAYPHLKSIHLFPMTGHTIEPQVPWEQRKLSLLFCGTYTSPEKVMDAIHHIPPAFAEESEKLIQQLMEHPSLTLEEVVKASESEDLELLPYPLRMQSLFLVDSYVRAAFRHKVLETVIDSGLPITICGSGFEDASFFQKGNASFHTQMPFSDQIIATANAKLCLNIMPNFKAGIHDRIFTSMLNQTLCCTDESQYFDTHPALSPYCLFYSLKDLDALPGLLEEALQTPKNPDFFQNMQKEAQNNHSWSSRASLFSKILQQL